MINIIFFIINYAQGCILFYGLWFFSPTPRVLRLIFFPRFSLIWASHRWFASIFPTIFLIFHVFFLFLNFSCFPFPYSLTLTHFPLLPNSLPLIFFPNHWILWNSGTIYAPDYAHQSNFNFKYYDMTPCLLTTWHIQILLQQRVS